MVNTIIDLAFILLIIFTILYFVNTPKIERRKQMKIEEKERQAITLSSVDKETSEGSKTE